MVPGGGFEPPTRGFSVHCSTPELPGHGFKATPLGGGVLGGVGWGVQCLFLTVAQCGLRGVLSVSSMAFSTSSGSRDGIA